MSGSSLGYTEGSGADVATHRDNGAGKHFQATVPHHLVGDIATPASEAAPTPVAAYGELIEAIESMRFAVAALTKTIGFALPNVQGQPIMEVRQATAANLAATVSGTVTANIGTGTLAALTTLTNQTQIGGFAANDQIPALMHLQSDSLRRNISVS